MKTKSSNYIGINQAIPITVLDAGLYNYISSGEINENEILNGLSESTSGKNRLQKALMHCKRILTKPEPILSEIKKHFSAEQYFMLQKRERNIIILSLVSCLYPMAYNLLDSLAKVFKVQAVVNTKSILQKMSSLYGNNRSLEIGVYSLLPMFIELELIKRIKRGFYEKNDAYEISHPIIKEIYVYSDIYLSGSKSILTSDIEYRSWYFYNKVYLKNKFQTKLIQNSGNGEYITIKK